MFADPKLNAKYYWLNPLAALFGNVPFFLFLFLYLPHALASPAPGGVATRFWEQANFVFAANCIWNNVIPPRLRCHPAGDYEGQVFFIAKLGWAIDRIWWAFVLHLPFTVYMLCMLLVLFEVRPMDPVPFGTYWAVAFAVFLYDIAYHAATENLPLGTLPNTPPIMGTFDYVIAGLVAPVSGLVTLFSEAGKPAPKEQKDEKDKPRAPVPDPEPEEPSDDSPAGQPDFYRAWHGSSFPRDVGATSKPTPPPCAEYVQLETDPNAYDRVIGLHEAKEKMQEAMHLILGTEESKKMKKYGLKPPKGILLHGPPGTGKTSFARASAAKFGLPFIVVNASAAAAPLVGQTEQNIRDIFAFARRTAPCVVFWDEIDAVGKRRTGTDMNTPSQLALNVLLAELDGFKRITGIVLVAATNRLDVIDEALLRPGRFDFVIEVGLPNWVERKQIIRRYLEDRPHALSPVNLDAVAKWTEGMSPAHLEALVNDAARQAYKSGQPITLGHFRAALISANVQGIQLYDS